MAILRCKNLLIKKEKFNFNFLLYIESKKAKKRGQQNHDMWENARQLAKEGRFDEIPAEMYIKHLQHFQQIRNIEISKTKPMDNITLRPWQQDLLDKLMEPPNTRTIYWYWSQEGDVGKSFMATYLARNHSALTLSSGKSQDIAYIFQPTKIVCFDLARSTNMDHVNFVVMEDIKNGRIMSSKYMSCVKYFDSPHMVVFANQPVPHGVLSEDRIKEVRLRPEDGIEPSAFAPNFNPPSDHLVPPPLRRQRTDDLDFAISQDLFNILNA